MCNNIAGEDSNVLDAAVNGATQSVFLIGNIAASLVAFLAFIAFLNGVLGWLGLLMTLTTCCPPAFVPMLTILCPEATMFCSWAPVMTDLVVV